MDKLSPLWCANDAPHAAHATRNEFGGTNYCSGRPEVTATLLREEDKYRIHVPLDASELPCLFCSTTATWDVVEKETAETMEVCDDHKYTAFS